MHASADLTVSNLRAAQRIPTKADDSKFVDIWYDLVDDGNGMAKPVTVSLRISNDDAQTFAVPAKELRGAIGAGQTAGKNKLITWNAGVDWNLKVSPNMRFEVTSVITPSADDELVLIPAGSFSMGDANADDAGDELPVHNVSVTAFYMGQYEVTTRLWDEVREWGLGKGYSDLPPGNEIHASKGGNHPVHSVSWHGVVKWCNAYSEKRGLNPCYHVGEETYKTGQTDAVICDWSANGYRLPTEAEWEKAARGGLVSNRFPLGNTITHDQSNYYSKVMVSDLDGGAYDVSATRGHHPIWSNNDDGNYSYTASVDSFAPNGYGLSNMAGNLIEWCWDNYSSSYYNTPNQQDPHGPGTSGSNRVIRGGGWGGDAYHCRNSCRDYEVAASIRSDVGFRIVRNPQP
jgi:sulfatase modifying factor 1